MLPLLLVRGVLRGRAARLARKERELVMRGGGRGVLACVARRGRSGGGRGLGAHGRLTWGGVVLRWIGTANALQRLAYGWAPSSGRLRGRAQAWRGAAVATVGSITGLLVRRRLVRRVWLRPCLLCVVPASAAWLRLLLIHRRRCSPFYSSTTSPVHCSRVLVAVVTPSPAATLVSLSRGPTVSIRQHLLLLIWMEGRGV